MNRPFSILLLGLTTLLLALPPRPVQAHTIDVASGRVISLEQMLEDLQGAALVFMGELHDNQGHHRAQLQIIRALHEAGRAVAVGVEMFRQDSQAALDRWVTGGMTEAEFRHVFEANWSMWPDYREIFSFAREAGLPMIGLNIPRELTQQVASRGYASLSDTQRAGLNGVSCDVSPAYQAFIRRTLGGHGHDGIQFQYFCEAQALWDSAMAQALIRYLDRHPDVTVVVLAGSGHAWKHGIPAQIERLRPGLAMRVLLPEMPGRIDAATASSEDADYLMQGLDVAELH